MNNQQQPGLSAAGLLETMAYQSMKIMQLEIGIAARDQVIAQLGQEVAAEQAKNQPAANPSGPDAPEGGAA